MIIDMVDDNYSVPKQVFMIVAKQTAFTNNSRIIPSPHIPYTIQCLLVWMAVCSRQFW
jgi:hypothetical protein